MLGEDGMVMDDGVTACLSENRFLMTTTTGNAGRVFAWLEEWLQTEWPELRVYLTSLTEQFATVALAGPDSRAILGTLTDDIDLDSEAFPFMSWREGRVAGLPARVFRVSYTGELSYEIVVAAERHAMDLWTALTGPMHGVTPLRHRSHARAARGKGLSDDRPGNRRHGNAARSGHGMDPEPEEGLHRPPLARPRRDARSDAQAARRASNRGPRDGPAEGAQILAEPPSSPPETMIGHVTSSYRSATLGRSIALALVRGGRDRNPGTVHVPLDDGTVRAEICDPRFYDPEGARLDG